MYNTKTEELTTDIIWEEGRFPVSLRIVQNIQWLFLKPFYCFIILEKRLTIA